MFPSYLLLFLTKNCLVFQFLFHCVCEGVEMLRASNLSEKFKPLKSLTFWSQVTVSPVMPCRKKVRRLWPTPTCFQQGFPSVLKLNLEQLSLGNLFTKRMVSMNHIQENFQYLLQQCFQLPVHEHISYLKERYYDLHDVHVQQCRMPPGEQKMHIELLMPVRGGRNRWAGERSWELLTILLPGVILEKSNGGFGYSATYFHSLSGII